MNNVVENIIDVLNKFSNDEITRENIIKNTNIKSFVVLKTLKSVDDSCLVKRNPIIYNREKLIASLSGNLVVPMGRNAIEPEVIKQPASAPIMNEIKFTNTIIDATLDPSISKFHATRSYKHLKRRMNPRFPLNLFVYGETGVGKSTSILHIAKDMNRPVVRANLSKFADVDDLFGGMRIVDGTTYFDKGPALVAMEMGAILLLDECDSADPQLLTDLHPVLERKGYLIKKIKQMVYPAPGFCVIATANTGGRGDLTGKYIGVSALNVAFLDRFATGIKYLAPSRAEMKQIISTIIPSAPFQLVDGLCAWYDQIDKAVDHGAIEDRPSPRKILDILELMMSDGIQTCSDIQAKECIIEGTNLMDQHISQAFAELWDSMLMSEAQPVAA